jgi:hypothetical protein
METETYQTISDYLAHTHYGIAEDVTPEELAALKDGSLAHATIALRYLAEIETKGIRLEANPVETRRDLLYWISGEIDASRWDDKYAHELEETFAALDAVHAFAVHKKATEDRMQAKFVELLVKAGRAGATKGEVARTAGISRPTLDAWLRDGTAGAGR